MKKGMEYSFIKLALIIFVVLLLMMALYRFYWKPAKKTLDPLTGELEERAQKVTDITGKAVNEGENNPESNGEVAGG